MQKEEIEFEPSASYLQEQNRLAKRKCNDVGMWCVNYQGLKNLTIKNWYFPTSDRQGFRKTKSGQTFTQLDLTRVYQKIEFEKAINKKLLFKLGMPILSTKSYFSDSPTLWPVFKARLIRSLRKSLTSLSLYNWMTSYSIPRSQASYI